MKKYDLAVYPVRMLTLYLPISGLLHKCRYSLGSIAIWTRAEQVELIVPFVPREYTTKKHFSYFKFFLPDNIDAFQLRLSNCSVQLVIKVQTTERCHL